MEQAKFFPKAQLIDRDSFISDCASGKSVFDLARASHYFEDWKKYN